MTNLAIQLKSPTLVRVDINSPVEKGRVAEDGLRLEVYGYVLELLSEYVGLVVMAHQGRPGKKDFLSLKQHAIYLRKLLPADIDIDYVPIEEAFTKRTLETIKGLKQKEILLLDNVRLLDEEYNFDPKTSVYVKSFKGLIKTCVNDAIPTWHRAHSSLMALPYIAPTYVGIRSTFELKALSDVLNEDWIDCGIIMGGSKLAKAGYLVKFLNRIEGFTGGLPGQLLARAKGFSLGEKNNALLKRELDPEQFELAKELVTKFGVRFPRDFIVFENGEKKNIALEDMRKSEGLIRDIGEETVEEYARALQEKTIRIRAGPLGVYEEGYDNGVKLTKMIAGNGLIFVGGDTSQEVIRYGLDKKISGTGGLILVGGGSFLHGLAGESYPSVDAIIKQHF